MAYIIVSGAIEANVLYMVSGASGSITYNGVTVTVGNTFRGVASVTAFTTTGAATVIEVSELTGGAAEFKSNTLDWTAYPDISELYGMNIEYSLTGNDKVVNDQTLITGASIEYTEPVQYSFAITETRL
ncbi:MAG: hypothetical protein JST50_01510 [Bacteroidetes bacterium]|jgi:hypothetical protein|nr:hypothetical protein [Bacteroidota bacterium]